MHRKKFLVTFLFLTASLLAIEVEQTKLVTAVEVPWFTGPLLAPSANVVPLGSVNFEPYLYLTGYTGSYTTDWEVEEIPFYWTYSFQPCLQFGIAPRVDLVFDPIFYFDECEWQKSWALGDTPVKIEVQLHPESKYIPAVKFGIQESFPTGKYKNLNPKKQQTDAGGTGSYITSVGTTLGKLIPIHGIHYLSARFAASFDIPSAVYVTGYNTYGGDKGTKGTYYPPLAFNALLGLELSLTQNWVFALDVVYIYAWKSRFKGIASGGPAIGTMVGSSGSPGSGIAGSSSTLTLATGPSAQISLAPAMEYNWSKYWGVIAGAWFTVAGKNSSVFQSGVVAINYYR